MALLFPGQLPAQICSPAPSIGQNRLLVILINFSDTLPVYGQPDIENLFFGTGQGTLRDFYLSASYGQLELTGDVLDWFTASETHDYYGNNNNGLGSWPSYPRNVQRLVEEAVDLAEAAGVDFSLYDNSGQGCVDSLIIVHQGEGGEWGGLSSDIWSNTNALTFGGAEARVYDGVVIDRFSIVSELSYNGVSLKEFGTIAHEYGHLLGIPDLFDKDGSSAGLGYFDLMSIGLYGFMPSAYIKDLLGWLHPTVIGGSTQGLFELPPIETDPVALKIPADPSAPEEYFLVANRRPIGYDLGLPAHGVAIYHADQRSVNKNNDELTECGWFVPFVSLEQADGNYDLEYKVNWGDSTDLYPMPDKSARDFHSATVPSSINHGCRLSGVSVTSIGDPGDTVEVTVSLGDFRPMAPYPLLMVDRIEWQELAGNGDRYPEGGERFIPVITLANNGSTALALTATIGTDSPYLAPGGTVLQFPDIGPGQTASATNSVSVQILSGYQTGRPQNFEITCLHSGGTAVLEEALPLGRPDILYVDDDGNYFSERRTEYYLSGQDFFYDRWEVKSRGAPSAADLQNYNRVLWITGPGERHPLTDQEISALSGYLDSGGNLILSSPNLLAEVSPGTTVMSFATDYLHVQGFSDDRHALYTIKGVTNDPISHGISAYWIYHIYGPLLNRTVALWPGAGAASCILNSKNNFTAVRFPAAPPGPYGSVFLSFGAETLIIDRQGPFFRKLLNHFAYRSGKPFAVDLSPTSARPKKVDLVVRVIGLNLAANTGFLFPDGEIDITATQFVSVNEIRLTVNVSVDAWLGWHDLLAVAGDGDTIRMEKIFEVYGNPLPNLVPVAMAGSNAAGGFADLFTLDGSSSYDPDYDPLTYLWEQIEGATVSLAPSNTAAVASFSPVPMYKGDYRFTLTVSDPWASSSDEVTISVDNAPPVSMAGADSSGYRSDLFTLDGSSSYDPDGDPVYFLWERLWGATVSILPSDTAATVNFSPAPGYVGDYVFLLTASDPWESGGDTVRIAIANQPPVADAGEDIGSLHDQIVVLDGASSYDPDGDPISYCWTQTGGPETVALDLSDPARPAFVPGLIGVYTFTLEVEDPFDQCLYPDSVKAYIADETNSPPTAMAGPDQSGHPGETFTLDGSSSYDLDLDPLTYLWTQLEGATVSLEPGDTSVIASFIPSVDFLGDLVFMLEVYDSLESGGDTVRVTVANRAPVALAGPDLIIHWREAFVLDGSSSYDPDQDEIFMSWEQQGGATVMLLPSDTAEVVTFAPVPGYDGDYLLLLTVSDGLTQAGDSVTITVYDNAPVADAGPSQAGAVGQILTLDGTGSFDIDGDTLSYTWTQLQGPAVTLDLADPARPWFPAADAGNYQFALQVDDSFYSSYNTDTTDIIVTSAGNRLPVAEAGPNRSVDWWDPVPVGLDGSGSHDPDGDTLSYEWTMISRPFGSLAQLSDPYSAWPQFDDDMVGNYSFSLRVFDGEVWSYPDYLAVFSSDGFDNDGDGDPDYFDPDDDNDLMPDYWETNNGFDPFNADDGGDTVSATTDPDGDGNVNLHEFYNQSDPLVVDAHVCTSALGGCFFGEGDGNFIFGPGDLTQIEMRLKSGLYTNPYRVYPENGDNFELSGDGNIGPGDLTIMENILKNGPDVLMAQPAALTLLSPGLTVSAQAGDTIRVLVRVEDDILENDMIATPRSGAAVIFEIASGSGVVLGGEAGLPPQRTLSPLSEVNTVYNESSFCLSRDELEIVVASDRPGGQGNTDLYIATRSSRAVPFGPLIALNSVNTIANEITPALSLDRLELYFSRYNSGTSYDIYRSTRPDLGSGFGAPAPVLGVNTDTYQASPSITDDGLVMYYASNETPHGYDIFRATRPDTGSSFTDKQMVTELSSDYYDNAPVISGNDTRIYLFSNRPASHASYNIWFAERTSPAEPFGAPLELSFVNTEEGDFTAWESADGKRLYFSTLGWDGGGGDTNIFMVRRPSVSLPFWVSDEPSRYEVTGEMSPGDSPDSNARAQIVILPAGCQTLHLAVYGEEDPIRGYPSFSLPGLIEINVSCP